MRFLAGIALAATLLTTVPALAQSQDAPPAAGQHQGRGMQKLLDQLSLTPDQQTKIQAIMKDDTLKGKARMDAVRAVLTPDQRQKMHDLMQQARQNRQGGPGGGAASPGATPPGN